MAMRSGIDWEGIEKEYRIGQLSVRAIGEKYKVSASSISKKAKQEGWVQDATGEVRVRTRAALLKEKKEKVSGAPTTRDIEIAVQTNVSVITNHRKQVGTGQELVAALMNELVESTLNKHEIEQDIIDDTVDDKSGMRRMRMLKAVSLPSRAVTLRDLAQSLKTLIAAERQAYNIDDGSDEESIDERLVRLASESGASE